MDGSVEPLTADVHQREHADESVPSSKPKLGRLSVNITPATQAALDRVVEREGVTVTEALRRLVGYGVLIYETTQVEGHDVLIRRGDTTERIVLV